MTSKCSSERESHKSLALNKNLELMIILSKEGMFKDQKLGLWCWTISQTVVKFLKEIKSAAPVNTQW